MEALQTFGIPFMVFGAVLAAFILIGEQLERRGIFERWTGLKPV